MNWLPDISNLIVIKVNFVWKCQPRIPTKIYIAESKIPPEDRGQTDTIKNNTHMDQILLQYF